MRSRWGLARHQQAGLQYLGMTLLGRGAVFCGLLVAAAVLPSGGYATFALAYQIALFVSYQVAYPINVAGYRLGAEAEWRAILKRMILAPAVGAAAAGAIAAALLEDPSGFLVVMVAIYGGSATLAVVGLGQAQAYGRALSFARWNAYGSLLFLALVGLVSTPSEALLAASIGMVVAPLMLAGRGGLTGSSSGQSSMGRPEATVFLANLAFGFASVVFLSMIDTDLAGNAADRVALLFTFLQAALMLPMQLLSLMQPRLTAERLSDGLEHAFVETQAGITMMMMCGGLVLAAALSLSGWTSWAVAAPLAISVMPVALGLASANGLMVAEGPSLRLIFGPLVFVSTLIAASFALGGDADPRLLTVAWLGSAVLGSVVQALFLGRRDNAVWLAAGLLAGAACVGLGMITAALGGIAAIGLLVAGSGVARNSVAQATRFVAVHR